MQRVTRRQVVAGIGAVGLGLVAGCGRWPGQAPANLASIGYLGTRSDSTNEDNFRHGLGDLGYVEGRNIVVAWRVAESGATPLPQLAAELVQRPVDVLVVQNNPAALAAREASSTIPIVMAIGDPVGTGLAASLGRPGGNVTGLTNLAPQLGAKRLELFTETIPGLARVAVLWPPYNPVKVAEWTETQSAGRTLGVQLQSLEVRGPEDLEPALAAVRREHADGLIVFGDNLTAILTPQIVRSAAISQLPTMWESRQGVDLGGLIAYGPSFASLYRRAAYYVDRILKGAKPADLPIEQPREFDFVINLQTAHALGLTIPPSVLLQATEVLQ